MSMDKMLNQFKDLEEVRSYAEAQFATILELSKKIQKLDEENTHLKQLLANSTPILEDQRKELLGYNLDASNEEIISTIQLSKLKEISFGRELTLEETKRVEIFSKILLSLRSQGSKKNEIEVQADVLSTDELLRLVKNGIPEAK